MLAMAESSRGAQVELGWTTGTPGQSFVLDVQWDASADDPVWSLYEESGNGSQRLWSQPFDFNNLEMFYDVLVMSCGAVTPSEKLSSILKPKPGQNKEDQSKTGAEAQNNKNSQPESKSDSKNDFSLNINPGNESQSKVEPTNAAPTTGAPVTTPGAFPPPPYNMVPGVFPVAYPPGMVPAPGYVTPPAVAPPGWAFTPVPLESAPVPMGRPVGQALSALPIDSSLVNKRYDILLAELLEKAELLSKPTLAAAVKCRP